MSPLAFASASVMIGVVISGSFLCGLSSGPTLFPAITRLNQQQERQEDRTHDKARDLDEWL
ncbi:hypothetical protein KAM338_45780 [Aeromonas caviae]|nr:hypothetical protein KAM338_45780 [Aeromonas caviae]